MPISKNIFVHISQCRKIFIVDCSSVEVALVSDYFVETFIPVCLLNNNHYILHAACLSLNNKAILLCADSGTGKSTLAYKLYSKGWSVLSDDLICLLQADGLCYAKGVFDMPIKLHRDIIELFSLPSLIDVTSENKPNKICLNNVPLNNKQEILSAVCILNQSNNDSNIEIVTLGSADALHYLLYHTTGLWALTKLQKIKIILDYAAMIKICPFVVFSLKYPKNIASLDELYSILNVYIGQANIHKLEP